MNAPRRRLSTLAVLVAAGAFALPARGDEPPLPAGTEHAAGIPPYVPGPGSQADPARTEWIRRMVEAGRAAKGTRRAAELLYSAADAQAAEPAAQSDAGRTFYEAWASAPADDPMGVLGALASFHVAVALGRYGPAQPFVAWLEAYERRYVPPEDDPVAAQRFALLRRALAARFPSDVATLLSALGDHAEAARRLERAAADAPPGIGPLAPVWERAALERFRAGQTPEAREDVRRALEAGPDPAQRARLLFWELHLRHGLLTEEGEMRPTGAWPGPVYLYDLDPVLRELHRDPHVGALLLSAASSALLARADADALALYQRVLADTEYLARSGADPTVWGALLPAVTVAARLERFDEAEALLGEIERLAGKPVPLAEALRARVKLAREETTRRREGRGGTGPGAEAGDPGDGRPRAPPEIMPPAPAAEAARRTDPAPGADRVTGAGPWLLVVVGLVVLGLLALLRRRSR